MDKKQPQAIELESHVLSAVIEFPHRLSDIAEILDKGSFYDEKHKRIWSHVEKMYQNDKKLDRLTLMESMRNSGDLEVIGGEIAILDLCSLASTDNNLQEHALIVKQKQIQRDFIKLTSTALNDAYDRDIDVLDIVDLHLKEINALTALKASSREKGSSQLWKEFRNQIKSARENAAQGILSGVPSGLSDLDEKTNGWQQSDLIIVAARPGMGKSAFAKKCIIESVKRLQPVLLFSMEMPSVQWMARIASEEKGLQAEKFLSGTQNIDIENSIGDLAKTYSYKGKDLLFIDDTAALTISAMKSRAKRLMYENNIELIIVDYIQLMGSENKKGGNREQDVSEMSRGLKEMAKEFNVPVIALSQLNRSVETRGGDMRPKLSDLRESGAIEQDADMVLFLYRPEYYYQQGHERFASIEKSNGEVIDSKGIAEILISKHRNGALGNVVVRYVDYLTKFTDIDDVPVTELPF